MTIIINISDYTLLDIINPPTRDTTKVKTYSTYHPDWMI